VGIFAMCFSAYVPKWAENRLKYGTFARGGKNPIIGNGAFVDSATTAGHEEAF
jgi:hypothetical protein